MVMICPDCGWRGPVSRCVTVAVANGARIPRAVVVKGERRVAYCPKCQGVNMKEDGK
jgi:alkyl hydroperoxide reductase subunit AhpF